MDSASAVPVEVSSALTGIDLGGGHVLYPEENST
jgi:hypothetical protein